MIAECPQSAGKYYRSYNLLRSLIRNATILFPSVLDVQVIFRPTPSASSYFILHRALVTLWLNDFVFRDRFITVRYFNFCQLHTHGFWPVRQICLSLVYFNTRRSFFNLFCLAWDTSFQNTGQLFMFWNRKLHVSWLSFKSDKFCTKPLTYKKKSECFL